MTGYPVLIMNNIRHQQTAEKESPYLKINIIYKKNYYY